MRKKLFIKCVLYIPNDQDDIRMSPFVYQNRSHKCPFYKEMLFSSFEKNYLVLSYSLNSIQVNLTIWSGGNGRIV